MVAVPLLLLLPLADMMRDSARPADVLRLEHRDHAVVIIGARLDGGSSSPLDALLFITLGFMAARTRPTAWSPWARS